MDFLFEPAVFSLGVAAGWFLRGFRPRIERRVEVRSVVQSPGPENVYARFHFADGRVEVRKYRPEDHAEVLEYKGRRFAQGDLTEDGRIYHEVLSGR